MQKHKYINSKDFLKACRICDYSELNPIHFQPSLNKECKCTEDTIMGDCPVHRPNTSQPTEKPMDTWEDRFDKEWETKIFWARDSLKQFIVDELAEQIVEAWKNGIIEGRRQQDITPNLAEYKQKLIKRLQGMKKRSGDNWDFDNGYESAIDDVLDEVEAVIKEV